MPDGIGGDFILAFHNSKKWQSMDDLIRVAEVLVLEFDFTVLERIGLSPLSFDHSKHEFLEYCRSKYKVGTGDWDENYIFHNSDGGLSLNLECPFLPTTPPPVWDRIVMLSNIYGQEYNEISFQMTLGERHLSFEKVNKYQKPLMDLYTKMALFLIPLFEPDYVAIYEIDFGYEEFVQARDVLQRKIKFIYWANYFAPGFLNKEQEAVFSNAPIGIAKLSENGLWYYINEDFSAFPDEEMLAIEKKANKYFSKFFNLTRVQWRFFNLE
jgi:hypothetical protein